MQGEYDATRRSTLEPPKFQRPTASHGTAIRKGGRAASFCLSRRSGALMLERWPVALCLHDRPCDFLTSTADIVGQRYCQPSKGHCSSA
jgi:hypothetical protein